MDSLSFIIIIYIFIETEDSIDVFKIEHFDLYNLYKV